jgi:polysaccharide biosynthesis protein PslG
MQRFQHRARTMRRLISVGVVVIVLAVLLGLDLSNRGLAWQTFWSLTGEEEPLAQVRGMVEWLGNFTRMQPTNTATMTPINHVGVNPFGINTFLEQEVEPEKRERQVQMIADAGFHWIRQEFPWEDIEIHARGDFEDRRNDHDGDGQPDAIDAWAKYDMIVDLAEQYGLEIQARLSNPPDWTHADLEIGDKAPPDDLQDFVNFAVTMAERYRGRIRYYQIWNEPNIFPEWGNQDVNPEAYTEMLCRTYDALKAVDPDIVVISGALAGTIALTPRDLNDFIFLQRMYDAGAGACFDILSAQGYGLNSGPTDQRMRPTTVTFARHVYIRDLMVANGDASKPIWISEAAWNPIDEPSVPQDIPLLDQYGRVTQAQAARYMTLAYQRAHEDWPWIGVINYWFFKRASDAEANQPSYYFRMVEPDFTPLPIYDAMREYIHNQTPVLYAGVHQAEGWGVTSSSQVEMIQEDGAEFRRALSTVGAEFTAYGTDIIIRWRGADELLLMLRGDGTFYHYPASESEDWNATLISLSNSDSIGNLIREVRTNWQFAPTNSSVEGLRGFRHVCLGTEVFSFASYPPGCTLSEINNEMFILDSITVLDRTVENVLPLVAGVGIAVGMTLWVVISALRARRQQ